METSRKASGDGGCRALISPSPHTPSLPSPSSPLPLPILGRQIQGSIDPDSLMAVRRVRLPSPQAYNELLFPAHSGGGVLAAACLFCFLSPCILHTAFN